MYKSHRNVASVNGNPVNLQKVVDGYKADVERLTTELAEAREVAEHNYVAAEELGQVLELTQAKLAEAEAVNGELQRQLEVNAEDLVSQLNEPEVEKFKTSKKKKVDKDEQVSVEVQPE